MMKVLSPSVTRAGATHAQRAPAPLLLRLRLTRRLREEPGTVLAFFCAGLALFWGCAAQVPQAHVDLSPLKDSVVGLGAWVDRVDTTVGDVSGKIDTLNQAVSNYDTWTLRILAAAPWVAVGLPLWVYVIPKYGLRALGFAVRLVLGRISGRK